MIDRGGSGQVVGEALLEHAHVVFAWWHWVRDGTWTRSTFQSYVRTLRASFKLELEWGSQNACPKTAATCRELLAREAAIWTFVRVEGIEPTNNASEVRLVGQKPNTQDVWRIGPGTIRTQFLWSQNLIPVSV
jgi:transposase